MSRSARLALIASAALVLAMPAAAQPPALSLAQRDRVWAQSYSDLPADPSIVFGTLPNGMRYAIQHNETPKGQVSVRLRIGSGSLEERDDQQGLAHVLEHMAFKGTPHAPGPDEMVKILQRLGLAFGADTNAATGFTDTVYQFDLPHNDSATVSQGLLLLREIGGDLLLKPEALEPERGVVLSEERLRDTPDYEALKARMGFQLKGQLAADRLPIGKVNIVRTAPVSLIREFYRANYRPDRATLVVTGDIDPATIEREIKDRFSDWKPVGPETRAPDLGAPVARGPATQLVVRNGVGPSITVDWITPFDTMPDSVAKQRRDFIRSLALAVLNRRYARMAHAPNPPFLGASAGIGNVYRSAHLSRLTVSFQPKDWRGALQAAVETQRQALQYGFSQAEVDREVTEAGVAFRNAVAGASTRRTPTLANELVRVADDQEVETSPTEDLKLFQQFTQGLTAAEVDTALHDIFQGSGPLVSMVTPDAPDGGEGALAAVFHEAETAPVAPLEASQTQRWTHTDFGTPGTVAERRDVADLGVAFVRFANGVRLTVKPTAFSKDQVQVGVYFGHGRLDEPKDRPTLSWADSAFVSGGLSDLPIDDLRQVLADRTYSIGLGVEDDAFLMAGSTRPKDLDLQLQVLAAYMTQPGWRAEAFNRNRDLMGVELRQLPSTPEGVEALELPLLQHSGDSRWAWPTQEQLSATKLEELKALLQPALGKGEIEVVVVGDVTVDQAIRQTAETFGALPARTPEPVAAGQDRIRFPDPSPTPVLRLHHGRPDQAEAYIAWPAEDLLSDVQRARRINMVGQVLELRLIDKIRVAEGATYSPSAGASESDTFPGYGQIYASVEIPPAKVPGFYTDVDRIAADLRSQGITPDELTRATRPRIEAIEKGQQTNGYWLAMLHRAQVDPRRLELIRTSIRGYQKMTVEDVNAAVRAYLNDDKAWRFEVEPEHPSAATPVGATPTPVPSPPPGPATTAPASPPHAGT
ncbi:MAG: insulinase family protein [Caulobacteraceae bacterium]